MGEGFTFTATEDSVKKYIQVQGSFVLMTPNFVYSILILKSNFKKHILNNMSIDLERLTTQVMGLRCPTKSLSVFQLSRSIICAVGPPLFMAWADTKYCPSGDQLGLSTVVVPPHCSKDTHNTLVAVEENCITISINMLRDKIIHKESNHISTNGSIESVHQ